MCRWAIQCCPYISPRFWDIRHISVIWTHFSKRIWQSSERLCMNSKKNPQTFLWEKESSLGNPEKFRFLYEVPSAHTKEGNTFGFFPKFLFGDHFIPLENCWYFFKQALQWGQESQGGVLPWRWHLGPCGNRKIHGNQLEMRGWEALELSLSWHGRQEWGKTKSKALIEAVSCTKFVALTFGLGQPE